MLKRFFLSALAFLALCGLSPAGDLAPLVADGSLWTTDKPTLGGGALMGVRYAPVDEHTMRIPCNGGGLQLGKVKVGEILLTFEADEAGKECISHIETMIYNKGDDGAMGRDAYMGLLEQTQAALTELAGGIEPTKLKLGKKDAAIQTSAWLWEGEGFALRLEAAANGLDGKKRPKKRGKNAKGDAGAGWEAEFIRLAVGPDAESLERGGAKDAVKKSSLKGQKKKDENGDVWIDGIPMVDQGQKGYCVPASVARVFAYYGMDGVDQHVLAALCESSGDSGTSLEGMEEALNTISRKYHVKVANMDKGGMMELLETYNTTADKMHKPTLSPSDPNRKYDPEVMKEAFAGKPSQVKKWLKSIKKCIDAGQPVLWSVQLGIFPEEGLPQAGGGHMRLIIGYNEKENTIIYSDSWGARHARKTMPADQAAAMTMRRYQLKPSR